MRLLQGLVALGGPKGIILTPDPTAELPRQLRLFLEPKFEAVGQDALVVRESMTSLLAEIGLTDGGDNIRAIKACLLRMANVTVVVTNGIRQRSFHLMSYAFDEEDGRLFVALNPPDCRGDSWAAPVYPHRDGRGAGATNRPGPPYSPAAMRLDRSWQSRARGTRYACWLRLAGPGERRGYEEAPPESAQSSGRACYRGLEGERVCSREVGNWQAEARSNVPQAP